MLPIADHKSANRYTQTITSSQANQSESKMAVPIYIHFEAVILTLSLSKGRTPVFRLCSFVPWEGTPTLIPN